MEYELAKGAKLWHRRVLRHPHEMFAAFYDRGIDGVVVALIVRSKANVLHSSDGVPIVVVNNPTGAQHATTAAYCFPLGYVMRPDAVLPRSCDRCVRVCRPTKPPRTTSLPMKLGS